MKRALPLFLIIGLIFTSTNIFAQAIKEISFNTKIAQSQFIIEGKVISKKSFWDSNHYNIYTANKIEVYKVFKGNLTANIIEIITPGGIVGLQKDVVEPSLSLSYNETGIFMLKNNTVNYLTANTGTPQFEPYASVQGFIKYDLIENKAASIFNSYNNIDNTLYNSIQNLTNTSYSVIQPFNTIPKGNITNKLAPSISNFAPATLSAGTKTQLTINGNGFGATQGGSTVEFSDANDGGSSFFAALPTQTISWSNTQIIVEVPSRAGTGTFRIVNGTAGNSPSSLTISFSEINVTSDALSAGTFIAYQNQHINDDGNGGYTWQMFTDFDANANAKASFLRAFDSWRCTGTNINWTIGTVTTTDVVASDGINIVRDDNGGELPNGVLGVCTSRFSGCFNGPTLNWFVSELDIVFDDATNWNYGPAAPQFNEIDFETVAVHELGHGHQLGHVISPGAIMHFSVSNGTQNRTPGVNDLAGGNDVMSRSTTTAVCGNSVMTTFSCGSAPVADFSGNPTTLCEGSNVSFTDLSTNTPTSWSWSFTGGTPSTSTAQNPTITYNTAGTYQVVLTATNATGSDGETKVGFITVGGVPGNTGAITGSSSECENTTGIAYSIATISGATNYTWSVPSGATIASGQGSTNIIVNFGTNSGNVSVTPSNSCGNGGGNSKAITINVCGSAPVADFSGNPTTLCEGNTVSFTDLSTNTPTSWSWSFTGGTPSTSTAQNPTITYNTAGTYQVVLTATNANGSDGETKVGFITVNNCGTTNLHSLFAKTYLSYAEKVLCIPVTNAQEYEFEFTPTGGGGTIIYNRGLPNHSFLLGWAVGLSDGTTYNVRVRAKIGGTFASFGITKQLTTPQFANNTEIINLHCGKTYANYSDKLNCFPVSNATDYEFEFTPVGGGASITFNRGVASNSILLNMVIGLQDNTTYNVKVRAFVGGSFGSFGNTCQITTPQNSVTTTIIPQHCEKVYTSMAQTLNCHIISNATDYEFEFTPVGGGASITFNRGVVSNSILLNMVTGLALSTQYNVRVRPEIAGLFGAFGNSCQITTSATARYADIPNNDINIAKIDNPISEITTPIKMIIYPNPSQGEFIYIELKGLSPNSTILVSDIYGKTIMTQPIESNYENYNGTFRFDKKLDTGFYMITIVSGNQKTTKKLIVR